MCNHCVVKEENYVSTDEITGEFKEKKTYYDGFDINEFLEDQARESSRERSVEYCGWKMISTQVDGAIKSATNRCKQWRTCENCYRIRFAEFQTRLNAIEGDNIVSIVCSVEDSIKLLRKREIDSEDYSDPR